MVENIELKGLDNEINNLDFLIDNIDDYKHLIESFPQPILIHHQHEILYFNQATNDSLMVKEPKNLIGKSIFDFIPKAKDQNKILDQIENINNQYTTEWIEIEVLKSNNEKVYLEVSSIMINYSDTKAILTIFKDIAKYKEIEDDIKESKEQLKSLFNYNPDAIYALNLKGEFLEVNPASVEMSEYKKEELLNMNFYDLIAPQDKLKVWCYYQKALAGQPQKFKCTMCTKYNQYLSLSVKFCTIKSKGRVVGGYAIAKDITKEERMQQKIEYIANHDSLTNLPNRYFVKKHMQNLIDHQAIDFALLFIDLDKFKIINDTLGHDMGDELLKDVGDRLKNSIRKKDIVGRLGGDEFVVLIKHPTDEIIKKTALQIIERLSDPFKINDNQFNISVSIGIAKYPESGNTREELIKNADIAMYKAKERIEGSYQFYNRDIEEDFTNKLQLENDLKNALENDELFMIYQPQFDLSSEKLTGIEALIRWKHPQRGLVSPMDFIPLAEDTGLIIPIGKWVLKTVCEQNKKWQDAGFQPIRTAVNVSIRQLQQDDFVDTVREVISETGLPPKFLEIEITENIMRNVQNLQVTLQELKEIGVTISVDDFGTGYSSLNIISDLPIDNIKIDKSFINSSSNQDKRQILAKTIIELGHNLNFDIIAEGIETSDQLLFLRKNNCNAGQGYFFSKPIDTKIIEDYYLKVN